MIYIIDWYVTQSFKYKFNSLLKSIISLIPNHAVLYMCCHCPSLHRRHIWIRNNVLTRGWIRQPRDLRNRSVRTVRHHRVHHVRTCRHHGTGVREIPHRIARVRRRRGCSRGVRRVGRWQPHIGVPEVGVTVGGAEARVYGTHAGQTPVRYARMDVWQIVHGQVLAPWKLVGLEGVELESCWLEAWVHGGWYRWLHHWWVVISGVVHVGYVAVIVLSVLKRWKIKLVKLTQADRKIIVNQRRLSLDNFIALCTYYKYITNIQGGKCLHCTHVPKT